MINFSIIFLVIHIKMLVLYIILVQDYFISLYLLNNVSIYIIILYSFFIYFFKLKNHSYKNICLYHMSLTIHHLI
jgi:NADH:ubiquinone oxidoreductase subunit 3 (subunit A)